MQCPRCQANNSDERRFCGECGSALPVTCRGCGFQNQPPAKFCGGCGAPLTHAEGEEIERPSPEPLVAVPSGERRPVTIFFADLAGYTQLSNALDAEDLHDLVGRVFDAVDRIVDDHGGTVHRHVGDEVMALFGTPIAHGDDPLRAVRAAFETHKAMAELSAEQGRPIAVHIGIASGEVVVAAQGQENPQDIPEYAVTGVAANLASRLTGMAEAGQTLIADPVYRALNEHVECESLGEVAVKGLDKAVPVWQATGLREDGTRRARSRFVGRRTELAQFNGVLQACSDTGTGQAIFLRGEAGLGKTRLVEEFEANAERQGFACHKSFVLDFGMGKGQNAVSTFVSSLLAIPTRGDIPTREAAAERALADGLYDPDQRVFLSDLLDLPQPVELRGLYDAMDNATRSQGRQELVAGLIQRLSVRHPRLLTVEDIHWADPPGLAHLAQITTAVQDCPAVLVMTSRIEGDPLDQAWRGSTGASPLITVDLGPLRKEEAIELAGEFSDASNEFAMSCIERAEGSPLFLEQLLRSAEESGSEEVPATIQSLVLARVDRLPEADKRALQAASAIGQCFALDALRALLDDPGYACEALIEHYLVRPEGEDYLFAHALIQEVVYASLLKAKRSMLHRRAAEWFADRDPVLRAEHLDRADDPSAPGAYLEAAQTQASEYHYDRALQLVERGLNVANDQADIFALTCFRGKILHDLGSITGSIDAYQKALEFADADVARCRAWIGLAAGMRVVDRYDEALEALEQAETAATKHGLTLELARIHHLRGNLYFPLGNIEGCREEHELALLYARKGNSPEDEAYALSGLGDAEYARGRMITAHSYFRQCVDLSRELGFGRIEVANLPMIGHTRHYFNELEGALDDSLAAIEAATTVGHHRAELIARGVACFVLTEMAKTDLAKNHIEQAQTLVRRLGARRFEARNLLCMAKILRLEGRRTEAGKQLEEAIAISRETGIGFVGPRILGELALATDNPNVRQSALDEGEMILRAGSVGHNHLWFYRDALDAALNIGDWDGVERYAATLEEFTRPEPLPWTDFFIARGRALAAYGRGKRDDATLRELQRLRVDAARVGLKTALRALDEALTAPI